MRVLRVGMGKYEQKCFKCDELSLSQCVLDLGYTL